MTDQWQTSIDIYSDFPRCCKSFQEMNCHTDNAYGDETAFYCSWSMQSGHRIVEEECQGFDCPFCQLVGIEEYNKRVKS